MKKLLGLLLAMAVAFPASADILKNVTLKGEIQTIASDVRHNDVVADARYNSGTNARALAGLSFDLVEDVRANVLFQYGYAWGSNNTANEGFDNADGMKLVEANVVLSNLFCCLEASIGRQFYGDENSAVMYFGPTHYNAEGINLARALDAAKISYSDDFKSFTMIAGKVADLGYDASATDGTAIYGADLKLNLTDVVSLQAYGYDLRNVKVWDGTAYVASEDNNVGFYGAKLAFNPEAALLSVEYARNFEGNRLVKEHKDTGYMVKADGAIDFEAVTARAAFLYSNGNFFAFGNYRPGLLIGDPMKGGIFDYTEDGVRMFNVGFDFKPYEKWTVSLDGYTFQSRFAHHTATFEADLTAKYAHNEYVELFAGVGYAKYGNEDEYKAEFGKDNTKGQLGMLIKF
ncbi:MAG: hypothetical protein ACI351_00930 [Candidatus Avelusimicrobium sp.]|uniref:hypothetical protein n=1 Tax=Candidatus Avelusimicrobium sp. TaxID=3048833 RepID=UPI003EFDEB38